MIVYFADRFCNVIHTASTKAGVEQLIVGDESQSTLETGVKTLELRFVNNEKIRNVSKPGNLILQRTDDYVNELYIIIEQSKDNSSNEITLYCEDGGMDLLNTSLPSWQPKESQTIDQCLKNALGDDYGGWIIPEDIKSATEKKEKDALQFSADETRLARLKNIVSLFEYEMYFSYDIEGLSVIQRKINIVKKRGEQTPTHTFTYGTEVSRITEKGSIENLSTGFTLYGVNKKNAQKELKDLTDYKTYSDRTITPEDTDIPTKRKHTYKVDGNRVICVDVIDNWKSIFNSTGELIRVKETNYTTAKEAIEYAIRELEKVVDGEWVYTVEFPKIQNGIKVGDYIKIVDEFENLYLQSRVTSIKRSEINNTMSVEISDTTKLESQKPETSSVVDSDTCTITTVSTNGLSSTYHLETTIQVYILLNGSPIVEPTALPEDCFLQWYENIGTEEVEIDSTDSRIRKNGFELHVDVSSTSTYRVELRRDAE